MKHVLFSFLILLPFLASAADRKRLHVEVEGVGFDMILVEGGSFTMGATLEQAFPLDNELPLHEVKLSDYYIGETEVTQALWDAVTGQLLAHFRGDGQLPVENVSWEECQAFISMLQQKTALRFCLPTEAQWEYAARGGRASQGYQYAGSDDADEVAWYGASQRSDNKICPDTVKLGESVDASRAHTYPVAQKKPNELGIYDMSGNVAEWTATYLADYPVRRQKNPQGPAYGTERVFRGGCWYFDSWAARVSQRQGAPASAHYCNLGLRLALPKYYKM